MNVIVTTTINPPTKALKLFAQMPDWTLIVVGDLKTPGHLYTQELPNAIYVSPAEQEARCKPLSDAIGWNCIQRRNFGFLWAKDMGAKIVGIVDDDNIPLDLKWGSSLLLCQRTEVNYYQEDGPVFDPVGCTNYPHLWHRGFPLQLLAFRKYQKPTTKLIVPEVQADFWDGDPDIDAVCRMQFRPDCIFDARCFPIASSKISPFNSQNTFMNAELLSEYFLFPGIGRMDDIWASYYLQLKTGAKVVYNKPSVFQDRNEHNLIEDMKNEYIGYERTLALIEAMIKNPESINNFIPARAQEAFRLYRSCFE